MLPPSKVSTSLQMTLRPTYLFQLQSVKNKIWARFNSVLHSQKVLVLLVLCIVILCVECFQCYVIIDCGLTLISCTFQPMVALINHLLTYLLTFQMQTIGQNETVAQYILVAEGQRDLQNKHIGRRTNYYQPDRQEIYR